MDTNNLVVYLPFDSDINDLCGGTWTATGNPSIVDGALNLDGSSYLERDGGITLGGQDFTIRIYVNPSSDNNGTAIGIFDDEDGLTLYNLPQGLNHIELDYVHAEQKFYQFLNGVLISPMEWDFFATRRTFNLTLGAGEYGADCFNGTIDDFMIYDGVALHTENFTLNGEPWTTEVSLNFDVERHVSINQPWKLYNYGTADGFLINGKTLTDLPKSQSKTGTAFNQLQFVKCFDIPASNEIWLKFDAYGRFDMAGNDGSIFCGIRCIGTYPGKTLGRLGIYGYEGNGYQKGYDVVQYDTLQTFLLHLKSAKTGGVIEVWLDGEFLGRHTGNVNHGNLLEDICIRGGKFSNIMVSNVPIGFEEGWQEFLFDVERIKGKIVSFTADVSRNLLTKFKLYDTDNTQYFSGGTSTPVTIPTQDVVPPVEGDAHLQSIEISIAEQQLTDQVKIVGITPLDILFPVQGQYLDYVCDMRVEKVQRQGILYSADCCSDIDEILYTQFNYKLDSGFTYFAPDYDSMTLAKIISAVDDNEPPPNLIRKGRATAHLQKIADLLGKNCVCQFDDFTSNMNEKQSDVTFGDLISQLFGWTSRLPQRLINCYLRDDTLFAIQRGHESNVIDITDAEITLPTYERKLIRTLWGSGKLGIEPTTESEHVNNKHMVGGAKVFPMPPTTSPDGKTTYNYHNVSGYGGIDHGYALTSTTTTNDDGSRHEVRYNYGFEQGVYVCTSETAKDYDADGNLVNENKIIHHNLTPSQQFSRMEDEDGITTASNVGSNLPGFYNESYWLSLPHEVGYERDINKITGYNPLIDTDFPVLDSDIYAALIDAYAWLNRRTQETVTLSIYNCPHLFDFNDRILFDGNEYFLVGNTARTTSRIFNEQTLTLRRWF